MDAADEAAVLQASNQFYAALNAILAGDLGPMKEIWSEAEDVVYMSPSGEIYVGRAAVLADWEAQAAMNLGGEVRPAEMRLTLGQDLAVTHGFEKGSHTDPEGAPVEISIRATNLYRKEDGKWKMAGHHTDPLPFMRK